MRRKFLTLLAVVGLVIAALLVMAVPAWAQAADPPLDAGETGAAITFLVGALLVFLPGARGITWIVDRIRDALPDEWANDPAHKIVWPLLALAVALAVCLLWEIDVVGGLLSQIPRFADSSIDGTVGQVLTAVGMAGAASSWHDRDKAKNPPTLSTPGA